MTKSRVYRPDNTGLPWFVHWLAIGPIKSLWLYAKKTWFRNLFAIKRLWGSLLECCNVNRHLTSENILLQRIRFRCRLISLGDAWRIYLLSLLMEIEYLNYLVRVRCERTSHLNDPLGCLNFVVIGCVLESILPTKAKALSFI